MLIFIWIFGTSFGIWFYFFLKWYLHHISLLQLILKSTYLPAIHFKKKLKNLLNNRYNNQIWNTQSYFFYITKKKLYTKWCIIWLKIGVHFIILIMKFEHQLITNYIYNIDLWRLIKLNMIICYNPMVHNTMIIWLRCTLWWQFGVHFNLIYKVWYTPNIYTTN